MRGGKGEKRESKCIILPSPIPFLPSFSSLSPFLLQDIKEDIRDKPLPLFISPLFLAKVTGERIMRGASLTHSMMVV